MSLVRKRRKTQTLVDGGVFCVVLLSTGSAIGRAVIVLGAIILQLFIPLF